MSYRKAVIRYENARALTSSLAKEVSELISQCENILSSDVGLTCGQEAWGSYSDAVEEFRCYSADYDFIFFDDIRGGKGACDKCIKARAIKTGALAEAKQEFGEAKRALSRAAKKLIKGGV